jgi:hypothetical protein
MRDLRPDDADANEKSWLTTPRFRRIRRNKVAI